MSELVEFIRGCLDANEQTARAATPGPWKVYHSRHDFRDGSFCEAWGVENSDDKTVVEIASDRDYYTPEGACGREEDAAHIARHDPARVLAEVNAKRAILDMLADAEAVIARIGPDLDKPGDAAEWANYHAWRQAVEALAQPYAGEPGWRDEWGTQ